MHTAFTLEDKIATLDEKANKQARLENVQRNSCATSKHHWYWHKNGKFTDVDKLVRFRKISEE